MRWCLGWCCISQLVLQWMYHMHLFIWGKHVGCSYLKGFGMTMGKAMQRTKTCQIPSANTSRVWSLQCPEMKLLDHHLIHVLCLAFKKQSMIIPEAKFKTQPEFARKRSTFLFKMLMQMWRQWSTTFVPNYQVPDSLTLTLPICFQTSQPTLNLTVRSFNLF